MSAVTEINITTSKPQIGMSSESQTSWNELNIRFTTLFQRGLYAEAEMLVDEIIKTAESLFQDEHPDLATSLNNIAVLYKVRGNYQRSESFHKKALAIRENILDNNHPE